MDEDDSGMVSDRRKPKCLVKPVELPLCPAEIPHTGEGEGEVEFLGQLNTCYLLKKGCTPWSENYRNFLRILNLRLNCVKLTSNSVSSDYVSKRLSTKILHYMYFGLPVC
jgi:hypothetical protein